MGNGFNHTRTMTPYVDTTTYEDPSQALSDFTNEIDVKNVRIDEVIGSGDYRLIFVLFFKYLTKSLNTMIFF